MLNYKKFAVAFSYPEEEQTPHFRVGNVRYHTHKRVESDKLCLEYDRLFRSKEAWLYSAEYTSQNEFQRAKNLAEINGFYKAFGLETRGERPDALSCELEFMHYLIFKQDYAIKNKIKNAKEKANICLEAQKKFFAEHLYQGAKNIVEKILSQGENGFYKQIARELLVFLESEQKYLKK
jgi:TorA maturation chaperone TorD